MSNRTSTEPRVLLGVLVNQGGEPIFQVFPMKTPWIVSEQGPKGIKCSAVTIEDKQWVKTPNHTTVLAPNTMVTVIGDMKSDKLLEEN